MNRCDPKSYFQRQCSTFPKRDLYADILFSIQNICRTTQFFIAACTHRNVTHFLKSASSLSMSSLDSLLLSCLYRAEKRALLSSVPEASLNKGLQEDNRKVICFYVPEVLVNVASLDRGIRGCNFHERLMNQFLLSV